METKLIKKSLKEGIVNSEMLAEATYSYNKRAKNYRDKQYEWAEVRRSNRYWIDKYGYEDRAREKKEEYYDKKEELLSYVEPCKIHVVARTNYYGEIRRVEYYLYYEVGGYKFHTPIEAEEAKKYDIPTEYLDEDFETFGEDICELMSCQTADKIRNGLRNGTYKFVA